MYPGTQSFAAVYQVPVLGGTPRKIIDDVDTPLAFSPDGRQFAFILGSTVRSETAVMIANADEKFDEQGNLKDDKTAQKIRELLEALADWARTLKKIRT